MIVTDCHPSRLIFHPPSISPFPCLPSLSRLICLWFSSPSFLLVIFLAILFHFSSSIYRLPAVCLLLLLLLGYFFSIRASVLGSLTAIHWASERDYDSLGFTLYSRSGSLSGHVNGADGWQTLINTTLRNVHKFTASSSASSQLNHTVLSPPVRIEAGEEVSLYIFTTQNCMKRKERIRVDSSPWAFSR